jgi:hypothetical protein
LNTRKDKKNHWDFKKKNAVFMGDFASGKRVHVFQMPLIGNGVRDHRKEDPDPQPRGEI